MKTEIEIKLTPREMAEYFWSLFSDEQALFFIELGKITKETEFKAETQWLYVKNDLKDMDNGEIGIQCIRDIAAWHYLYLLSDGDLAL